MVAEIQADHESEWAAMTRVSELKAQLGAAGTGGRLADLRPDATFTIGVAS